MNKIKILTLGLMFSVFGVLMFANSAEAFVCTKKWNGVFYSYNYSASGSNGTFVFQNWANTQYNISINVVGKTTKCLEQADFNKMMSWSYYSDAQAFWNTGLSSWSRNLSCGNTHTYSKTQIINGVCGVADGATYSPSNPPTTGLCSSGTASAVTANSSDYTWSCAGQYGGTTDQCLAYKGNNSQATTTENQSSGGNPPPTASVTGLICNVSNTLPNLGEEVQLVAVPIGSFPGNGQYTWSWIGLEGNNNTQQVNIIKNDATYIRATSTLTINGDIHRAGCPAIEYLARPVISIVPPITNSNCQLSWSTNEFPNNVQCSVIADGAVTNYGNGSQVEPGKKYQIKCTYTPAGEGATATTTVSEIRACVKNPSLIEI